MLLLGKRLKELRLAKGLTQKEVGDKVNVTKVSVCCYEKGTRTPTLETLLDLCDLFKTNVNSLLGSDTLVIDDKLGEAVTFAHDEIELVRELRKHIDLYERLISDSKRTIELIEKKIR